MGFLVVEPSVSYCCFQCGAMLGERHHFDQSRMTKLRFDVEIGAEFDRAICMVCDEGRAGLTFELPELQKLKAQIRKARGEDQLDLLAWLVEKYPAQTEALLA